MRIREIAITNYRSIENVVLPFDQLTALVGANGTGKSSVLHALDFFYSGSDKITREDFFNRDEKREIAISIKFNGLSINAKERFSKYLNDDELIIEKVASYSTGVLSVSYHGARPQIPEFAIVRKAQKAVPMKEEYTKLLSMDKFKTLSKWSNMTDALRVMDEFEIIHPELCKRIRDDGKFFGFRNVAEGYLGEFSQFLYVPAVKDATLETEESRGSVLVQLMDLVVRSVIQAKTEVMQLKEKFNKEYGDVLSPDKVKELGSLAGDLTKTLQTLVPDSRVQLEWQPLPQLDIPIPKSDVKLTEDGFESPISNTGHGLQRAYVITLLQHLVLAKYKSNKAQKMVDNIDANQTQEVTIEKPKDENNNLPSLVLAIEEPELYQHPNRQKHFARILLDLAQGKIPGVADQTQIIYSTHSPLFVGIDRFNQVRQALKESSGKDLPKHTVFRFASLDSIAHKLWTIDGSKGKQHVGATLGPRLISLMTPWVNEGFFSRSIVLVEGEDDRTIVEALLVCAGCHPETIGMSIIPVGGKSCLDRPYLIFTSLGVPVYIIWDGDKASDQAKPEDNRRLLRLLGLKEVDWPNFIENNYAVWEMNLDEVIKNSLGVENYRRWLDELKTTLGITKDDHALKNPYVMKQLFLRAKEEKVKLDKLLSLTEKLIEFGKRT
jgi:putative ATP-dependent endonuclease of the OLD family